MAIKDNVQFSNCLLPPNTKYNQSKQFRSDLLEVFLERHWPSIQVNLELNVWTPGQIKMIQDLLRNG